jgi:type I restriction enzyme, R subunit
MLDKIHKQIVASISGESSVAASAKSAFPIAELRRILEIAKDTVAAENQMDPEEEQDKALAALTELFNEVKSKKTHVIVERLVADIDAIVREIRFDGWQTTNQGERLVQKELRLALRKYQLHTDQELFDKAYGYIRQYY